MQDPRTTQNVVFRQSFEHPMTLFPTAVGILGSLTTVLFGSSPITAGLAAGGLAIGAGSWAVNYFFRRDKFVREHLLKVQGEAERRMRAVLAVLEKNLRDAPVPTDAEDYAQQAMKQFGLIQTSCESFRQILTEKLDPNELTFNRFLMTAEQVNLAVLDNLQSIATRLKSISTIEVDYIRERMLALEKLTERERADEDEMKTLRDRQALRDQQMSKVNELLTYNEEALTQLARANAAIVEMRGKSGHSSMQLTEATVELEDIAKRARNL